MSIDRRRKKLLVDWPNIDASKFVQLNGIDSIVESGSSELKIFLFQFSILFSPALYAANV